MKNVNNTISINIIYVWHKRIIPLSKRTKKNLKMHFFTNESQKKNWNYIMCVLIPPKIENDCNKTIIGNNFNMRIWLESALRVIGINDGDCTAIKMKSDNRHWLLLKESIYLCFLCLYLDLSALYIDGYCSSSALHLTLITHLFSTICTWTLKWNKNIILCVYLNGIWV